MQAVLGLLACLLIFAVTLRVIVALLRRDRPALITLAAYATGAVIGWTLRPSAWPLAFLETLRATVDTARYGHPVEHQAELIILFWVMGAGVAAALLSMAILRAVGPASAVTGEAAR